MPSGPNNRADTFDMPHLIASLGALAAGPLLHAGAGHRRGFAPVLDGLSRTAIPGLVFLAFVPAAVGEGDWFILLALAAGFLIPVAIERTSRRATRPTHRLALLAGLSGFVVHTGLDGAVLATVPLDAAPSFPMAIVLHRLPVGVAVWWLVARCSAMGTYIGIIPGMGGPVSQWVAYAHAMQSSGKHDRVGTGVIEGVVGPGAANNSTLGGALIPTIAFGIPGNVTTAILLGAFLVLGLRPGTSMLTKDLHVTFSLVWVLVVSNVITVSVCFLFLNQLARLTRIKGTLLIPPLLLFIYLGSYTHTNSFGDILVTLVFGALGWLMVVFDWSRPALLLGLVLGRLADNYLWITYSRYDFGFITRPGVLIILCVILASIAFPVIRDRRRQRAAETAP